MQHSNVWQHVVEGSYYTHAHNKVMEDGANTELKVIGLLNQFVAKGTWGG